jgi:hypothetical protein
MFYYSVNGIVKTEPVLRVFFNDDPFAAEDRIVSQRGLVSARTGEVAVNRY